jgi:hypothetical protein
VFRQFETFDGCRKIDKEDFMEGMSKIGVSLSLEEASVIFASHKKLIPLGHCTDIRYKPGWTARF